MLQSGHGSRDRWTDGRTDRRTDRRTEWNQYTPQQLRCSGGIKILHTTCKWQHISYVAYHWPIINLISVTYILHTFINQCTYLSCDWEPVTLPIVDSFHVASIQRRLSMQPRDACHVSTLPFRITCHLGPLENVENTVLHKMMQLCNRLFFNIHVYRTDVLVFSWER